MMTVLGKWNIKPENPAERFTDLEFVPILSKHEIPRGI